MRHAEMGERVVSRRGPVAKGQLTPKQVETALRSYALGFPEATEDFPWGDRAIKVKGKVFLFMGADTNEVSFSVKLPHSRFFVLDLPNTEPTHYGLGKHGWVTARFAGALAESLDIYKMWIDESYRAVAPKKLVARLDDASAPAQPRSAKAKTAKKRPRTPT
jgi:predicted DNA-binding protein (MmcQ/YjbR family)